MPDKSAKNSAWKTWALWHSGAACGSRLRLVLDSRDAPCIGCLDDGGRLAMRLPLCSLLSTILQLIGVMHFHPSSYASVYDLNLRPSD